MLRKLLSLPLFAITSIATGSPFLIADVPPGGNPDQCVFTRTVAVNSPIVVDAVNGLPANGNRICKVDLAADSKTGTVTLALRDSVLGVTGPTGSYAFGVISAPSNLRVIP